MILEDHCRLEDHRRLEDPLWSRMVDAVESEDYQRALSDLKISPDKFIG